MLDLRESGQVQTLQRLIESADIFLQNLKPGALGKLGISLDSARESNPKLISCSVAGYSSQGPSRAKKAYDLLIQAETGLASITGSTHEPGRVGVSVCDIACGMFAYDALLLALIERGTTGRGKHIEVTLFDSLAQWMAVPYLLERYGGKAPERVGIAHPGIAPYGVFVAKDGQPFVLSIQNEREWQMLCTVLLKKPDWVGDPRTCNNEARVANRTLVDSTVAECAQQFDFAPLSELLLAADIAHAAVNEVSALREHGDFRTRLVRFGGIQVAVPVTPGQDAGELGPVPAVGEHTDEVLAELAKGFC